MKNKFSESVMELLRQRLGLEEDDTSRDNEINSYSMNEAFDEVLIWNGIIGYGNEIRSLIDDIYGLCIDDFNE